jgi:hypothetical protein
MHGRNVSKKDRYKGTFSPRLRGVVHQTILGFDYLLHRNFWTLQIGEFWAFHIEKKRQNELGSSLTLSAGGRCGDGLVR